MARRKRNPAEQQTHDDVVDALADVYADLGHDVWTNPGAEKNASVERKWPDVIVLSAEGDDDNDDEPVRLDADEVDLVLEVETHSSVAEAEAVAQWVGYDEAFDRWFLVVPSEDLAAAQDIAADHGLRNVEMAVWEENDDGEIVFDGLPASTDGDGDNG